jgi:hypothetical protein
MAMVEDGSVGALGDDGDVGKGGDAGEPRTPWANLLSILLRIFEGNIQLMLSY